MTDHERGIEAAKNILLLRAHELSAQELAEAAISAYLATTELSNPVAEAVKVKPLIWSTAETGTPRAKDACDRQYHVCSEFSGAGQPSSWRLSIDCRPFKEIFSSEEEAKAAAQADYEQRVMSALSTPPQPEAQALTQQKKDG